MRNKTRNKLLKIQLCEKCKNADCVNICKKNREGKFSKTNNLGYIVQI